MPRTPTTALIVICLVLILGLALLVADGRGALLPLALYLAALGACGLAIVASERSTARSDGGAGLDRGDVLPLALVLAGQLAVLIYMSTFPFHYVQDEFITGYASYTLPAFHEIHWFAGYPGPGEWIAGFPILYYALQKPFIEVVGLSLETIRISTWPYHLLTAGLVYLLGREMYGHRYWALIGAAIYVLLAPNAYMAGYGMHNISSTFFFLAAFYAALRMLRADSRRWAVASGLFAVMAYLTYTSSYLTVPLLLVLAAIWAVNEWSWRPLLRAGQVLAIVAVGLVPFATYALTQDNYFTERGDQVNAIAEFYGSDEVADPNQAMLEHVRTNIRSLYTPGIGGVTDYWFGKQALFDWLTLGLLSAGLALGLYRGFARRAVLELASVAVVIATFIFGMFLTLPPAGFHRTTLAFPFVALLITLAIRLLSEQAPRFSTSRHLQPAAAGVLIAAFVTLNLSALHSMVREDEEISGLTDSVPITGFIEERVPPGTEIIISAFPNYHLERELIVRTGDRYEVRIEPFDAAVEQAGDAVIVLFQPDQAQIHRLEARPGGGGFVDGYNGRALERHRIHVPPAYTAREVGQFTHRPGPFLWLGGGSPAAIGSKTGGNAVPVARFMPSCPGNTLDFVP